MYAQAFLLALLASTAIAAPLAAPQSTTSFGGSTKNDVQNGVCKAITLIFARGTSEGGNLGSEVGPPLEKQLESTFGTAKVATQGVNYDASVQGAVSSAINPKTAAGSTNMAQLTQQALKACPTTKVVLAGYSQGAEQVHGALMNLQTGNVAAAVTFGDPLSTAKFSNIDASRTKVFCATGDAVCQGQFSISAAHLSYGSTDIKPAVAFIQTALGNI